MATLKGLRGSCRSSTGSICFDSAGRCTEKAGLAAAHATVFYDERAGRISESRGCCGNGAIFNASLTEIDGKATAYIATAEVVDALVNVMASLIEGAPNCKSPTGIREMSEGIGRKLKVRTLEVRRLIAEQGRQPFAHENITPN
jgi:hypothetical protein